MRREAKHGEARSSNNISSPFLPFLHCVRCMVTGDWSALDDVCQQPVHCSLLYSVLCLCLLNPDIDTLSVPLSLRSPSHRQSLSLATISLFQLLSILSVISTVPPHALLSSTSRLLSPHRDCCHQHVLPVSSLIKTDTNALVSPHRNCCHQHLSDSPVSSLIKTQYLAVSASRLLSPTRVQPLQCNALLSTSDSPVSSLIKTQGGGQSKVLK